MRRLPVLLALAAATFLPAQQPSVAPAQATASSTPSLTTEQIQDAIEKGSNGKPHPMGIHVADIDSATASGLSCNTCGQTNYNVTAFTPLQNIAALAAARKRRNVPFTVDDVSPLMRAPVLRVYAWQVRFVAGRSVPPSPIQKIQLADASRKTFVESIHKAENERNLANNGINGGISASGEVSTFDMADVNRLTASGDIYIVIVTTDHSKYIKIKRDEFSKL